MSNIPKAIDEGVAAFGDDSKTWRDNPYAHRFWNTRRNQSCMMWWYTGYRIAEQEEEDNRVYNKE